MGLGLPEPSTTVQPKATLEIEVRNTVWQVHDIACVPVLRCIMMSGGGGHTCAACTFTREKGVAK